MTARYFVIIALVILCCGGCGTAGITGTTDTPITHGQKSRVPVGLTSAASHRSPVQDQLAAAESQMLAFMEFITADGSGSLDEVRYSIALDGNQQPLVSFSGTVADPDYKKLLMMFYYSEITPVQVRSLTANWDALTVAAAQGS